MKRTAEICWLDGRGERVQYSTAHYNADWGILVFHQSDRETFNVPVANIRWFKITEYTD